MFNITFLVGVTLEGKACIYHTQSILWAHVNFNAVRTYVLLFTALCTAGVHPLKFAHQNKIDALTDWRPSNLCHACLELFPHGSMVNSFS